MKSRRLRWAGHVNRMELKKYAYRLLVKNKREKTTKKTKTLVGG
jgi:hypothetical protein